MRYLCAHWSGCASEPDGTREHLQALVLVPFYPYFSSHFFRSFCTYTKGKSCVHRAVWQRSFPSLFFFLFNLTWSWVLAFLLCRIDASVAGWQHLSLCHRYIICIQVSKRWAWNRFERSMTYLLKWKLKAGVLWQDLGINGISHGQDVCLIGAIVALPGSTAFFSHGGLAAWWRVTRQTGEGSNEGRVWWVREGFGHCFIFRLLPWVATDCAVAFSSSTGQFCHSDFMAWHESCLGDQPWRTEGRCSSLKCLGARAFAARSWLSWRT